MHSLREEQGVQELSFNIVGMAPQPKKIVKVTFEFNYYIDSSEDADYQTLSLVFDLPELDDNSVCFDEEGIKEIQDSLYNSISLSFKDKPLYIVSAFSRLIGAYAYLNIVNRRHYNGAIYHFAY